MLGKEAVDGNCEEASVTLKLLVTNVRCKLTLEIARSRAV